MRLGNFKTIDGEDFIELLDHNHHVKGYVKDKDAYNNIILESDALCECEKELLKAGEREGDLFYRMTHPNKKFKENKSDDKTPL